MTQKKSGVLIIYIVFISLVCITLFLFVGCGNYYESEDYLNLSTKQKIIEVLRREGTEQGDYYIYQTTDWSEESKFEVIFSYDIYDDEFMLIINMENSGSPAYKEMFATEITENTYNTYIGELTYYGLEIASGGGLYNRTQLLDLSSLPVTTFDGDETYRDIAGTFAAIGLKIGVLQIHIAFEEFGIDFIGTYF